MTILFDTIENKILSDRSVRGMLIFDEYAESQSIKATFSGADIHSTVAFCYQKLRKENGAVGTIVQSLAQLPITSTRKALSPIRNSYTCFRPTRSFMELKPKTANSLP